MLIGTACTCYAIFCNGYLNIYKSDYNLSEDTDLSCQVLRFKWYFVNKLCRLPDFFKYQPLRKLTGLFIKHSCHNFHVPQLRS